MIPGIPPLLRRSFGWAGLQKSASAICAELLAPLTAQNKKQRKGLALLVGTALHVRGVNLNELAAGLCNRMSGNSESACSRILVFPFDISFRVGSPLVVDLDQHGADESG